MGVDTEKGRSVEKLEVYMEAQRLAVVATAAIGRAMESAGLKRAQVAEVLKVPKSRVTKVLDGETNMTLKTLAQFGLACGVRWQFVGVKAEDASVVVTAPESLNSGSVSPYIVQVLRSGATCDGTEPPQSKDRGPFTLAA